MTEHSVVEKDAVTLQVDDDGRRRLQAGEFPHQKSVCAGVSSTYTAGSQSKVCQRLVLFNNRLLSSNILRAHGLKIMKCPETEHSSDKRR